MKIEKVVVGPLQTNCYLLWNKSQTIIIDPGAEPEKIFSLIASPVSLIIATHGHPDHVGAVWAIKHEFPEAKFLIHQEDLPVLRKTVKEPPKPDGFLEEGKLEIVPRSGIPLCGRNWKLEILHTPGHSPGGICLLGKNCLFTGDTLFAQGIGRTDYPLGDKQEMIQSLKKLAKLPKNLTIYPGHGLATSLGQSLEWLQELPRAW